MKILALLIMLTTPGAIIAQEICLTSFTVHMVSVASHTATLVDSSSLRMQGRKWVELQNTGTDVIRCSNTTAVSHSVGRILTVSGGTYEPPVTEGFYSVNVATYASRTFKALGVYCTAASTNTVGSIALSQCK